MIIKIYDDDGRPDLSNWLLTCDLAGCRNITPVIGSVHWLVPADPAMPIYCPTCAWITAACLITWAIRCPGCGDTHLRLWRDPGARDKPRAYYCQSCGASLWSYTDAYHLGDLIDGWDLPPESGWQP